MMTNKAEPGGSAQPPTAWLFPGQGSQIVGMAQDLYQQSEAVRDLYAEASDRVGFDLARISFDGPPELLQRTEYAQPCLLVASTACARLLSQHGMAPLAVAGHSLGEYSALVQAGVLRAGDAAWAVRRRGELMATAAAGTMAAILGLDDAKVEDACARAGGVVVPANYNAPGQVVISGTAEAVAAASALAHQMGAMRVVPLRVSGPFHSPLMAPIAAQLAGVLGTLTFSDARMPVVCNVEATPVHRANDFPPLLVRQVAEPVRWSAVMRTLLDLGVRRVIEVGPGRVLSGLARQIDRSLEVAQAGTLDAIDRLTRG